jgi:hypothetical protein
MGVLGHVCVLVGSGAGQKKLFKKIEKYREYDLTARIYWDII